MPEPLFWGLLSFIPGTAIWLGVWVCGRPGTIVALLGIAGWGQAWLEERIWLEPKFGEAFRAYRARVPAFFPWWLWVVLIALLAAVAVSTGLNTRSATGLAPRKCEVTGLWLRLQRCWLGGNDQSMP